MCEAVAGTFGVLLIVASNRLVLVALIVASDHSHWGPCKPLRWCIGPRCDANQGC